MKTASYFYRNYLRLPSIRALVPDLKLLLLTLGIGCESNVGAWIPVELANDSGLVPAAVAGGLADLERRGHILADQETGEVFLTDFFRENTFKTPSRRGQARADFVRVRSPKIRERIIDAIKKSPECGLSIADIQQNQQLAKQDKSSEVKSRERGAQGAPAPLSPGGDLGDLGEPGSGQAAPVRYQASPDGLSHELGNARDEAALALISNYPPAERAEAVAEAARRDKAGVAWPSAVLAILRASPNHQPPPQLSPLAIQVEAKRRAYGLS